MATCPKCRANERVAGQAWCRVCLTEYQRGRRAVMRLKSGLSGHIIVPKTQAEVAGSRRHGDEVRTLPADAGSGGGAGCQHTARVRAVFTSFTSDPAVRQMIGRVPGWGGFWGKVLAALDGEETER